MVWTEAVGEVEKHLTVSVNSLSKAVVEQAEGMCYVGRGVPRFTVDLGVFILILCST